MSAAEMILAELAREPWAMEPRALAAWCRRVQAMEGLEREMIEGHGPRIVGEVEVGPLWAARRSGGEQLVDDAVPQLEVVDGEAVVQVRGILLKAAPAWLSFFSLAATEYSAIVSQVAEAVARSDVERIRLQVDSPGGEVAGQVEAAEAIYQARQIMPVRAVVEDQAASGAYWLSSQADTIEAGPNASIGSIGVYMVMIDASKMAADQGVKVEIVRSGEEKGAGVFGAPISKEQLEGYQGLIDNLGQNFVEAVVRGRSGRLTRSKADELATGRSWVAAEAMGLGLIDAVVIPGTEGGGGEQENEVKTMADEKTKTEQEASEQATAAAERARLEERQRFEALTSCFEADPEFASAQYAAGASLDEAKVAYCEVLRGKLTAAEGRIAELESELEKAQAKQPAGGAPPADGTDPIAAGGEPEETEPEGFMAVSRERAKTDGIPLSKAMSRVAREQPELHQAFKDKCQAQAVQK